jgi:large subunit ribosomal protein L24
MRIKAGDLVEVITGDDRGARGKVLTVLPKKGKLIVEGVNRVYKHVRRSQRNTQGGRLSKEMPVNASNVLLVDPTTGRADRVGVRVLADGSKERYFKRSGAAAGAVGPSKSREKATSK